jgi:hypothetical protein
LPESSAKVPYTLPRRREFKRRVARGGCGAESSVTIFFHLTQPRPRAPPAPRRFSETFPAARALPTRGARGNDL